AAGNLTVRVHSSASYGFSNEVAVGPALPAARKKGTLYYLGVGVGRYAADEGKADPQYRLDWCKKDVQDVAECLRTVVAPQSRYEGWEPVVLPDEQATRAAVLAQLGKLGGKLKPADLLVVHFSCHGEKDPTDGGLYLLPHDWKPGDRKTAIGG